VGAVLALVPGAVGVDDGTDEAVPDDSPVANAALICNLIFN